MFCNAQQKVVELQTAHPTADATELISAICGDTAWLQEVRSHLSLDNKDFIVLFSYSVDSMKSCNKRIHTYFPMLK